MRNEPQSSFKITLIGYKVEIVFGEVWITYEITYNSFDGSWNILKTTSETWCNADREFVD